MNSSSFGVAAFWMSAAMRGDRADERERAAEGSRVAAGAEHARATSRNSGCRAPTVASATSVRSGLIDSVVHAGAAPTVENCSAALTRAGVRRDHVDDDGRQRDQLNGDRRAQSRRSARSSGAMVAGEMQAFAAAPTARRRPR